MLLRLTKIDEFQFLTCFKHQVWGSKTARFKNWNVGDHLVFIVGKAIAGLAQVSGSPYISKQIVWDNGVFPHRIPLKFLYVFLPENRLPILGAIRETLTSIWGPSYGWGLLNQQAVEGNPAEIIIKNITSRHIVLVVVVIGWLCFMVGVYLGPMIFSGESGGWVY